MKTIAALSNYRKGLCYMHRQPDVHKALLRYKIPAVWGWQADNQLKGTLPAWYGEVEHLTNKRVESLMWKTYETKPTPSQLKKVRAFFSWCYQLQTGKMNENFPCVGAKRKLLAPCGLSEKKGCGGKAIDFLTPEEVRNAVLAQWEFAHEWPLPRFSAMKLLLNDYCMNGGRPECLDRTKRSRVHGVNVKDRYMWTQMLGGRAKREKRLETMDWKMYRVCTCDGDKHNGLPASYEEQRVLFDRNGMPKAPPTWDTSCPISCWETVQHFMTRCAQYECLRIYPKWYIGTARFGKEDIGRDTMNQELHEFLVYLNVIPPTTTISNNSGRKSNGAMCDEYEIPYNCSRHWHGDLPKHWRRHYQPEMPSLRTNYEIIREQSANPLVAIKGQVAILQLWGRGKGMRGLKKKQRVKIEPKQEEEKSQPTPAVVDLTGIQNEVQLLKEEIIPLKAKLQKLDAMEEMLAAVYAKLS
jgi:hypothetical protein